MRGSCKIDLEALQLVVLLIEVSGFHVSYRRYEATLLFRYG